MLVSASRMILISSSGSSPGTLVSIRIGSSGFLISSTA
jgi:hypothetical protein